LIEDISFLILLEAAMLADILSFRSD